MTSNVQKEIQLLHYKNNILSEIYLILGNIASVADIESYSNFKLAITKVIGGYGREEIEPVSKSLLKDLNYIIASSYRSQYKDFSDCVMDVFLKNIGNVPGLDDKQRADIVMSATNNFQLKTYNRWLPSQDWVNQMVASIAGITKEDVRYILVIQGTFNYDQCPAYTHSKLTIEEIKKLSNGLNDIIKKINPTWKASLNKLTLKELMRMTDGDTDD